MIAGGYTLDLYCDNAEPRKWGDALVDRFGHKAGDFPKQYFGELGATCRQQARRVGWLIGKGGRALCPKCNKA